MLNKYALIIGEDVFDVGVFRTREDAFYVARAIKGNTAIAINVENVALDYKNGKYKNGKFYNIDENGNEYEAEIIPTQEQEINGLKTANEQLTLALASIIGGGSE